MVGAYDRLAPVYDGLAALWSGGQIHACHRHLSRRLAPGERALFVGAGSGRDAAWAADRGVRATLLDTSPAMLARAARRTPRGGRVPTHVRADVRTYTPRRPFDAVVASFFLNVFAAERLPAIVARLRAATRSGGRLLAADFAPAVRGRIARGLQRLYHGVPMQGFALLGASARHPIHDLGAVFERAGIEVTERLPVPIFGLGPAWLEVVEGRVP